MQRNSFTRNLFQPLFIVFFYVLVSQISFIAVITAITSVVISGSINREQFNQINDITIQYIFIIYAFAGLFTFLLGRAGDKALGKSHNFWPRSGKYFWSFDPETKYEFLRGIGSGLIIPTIVISLLILSGQLIYNGTFVVSDFSSPIFILFILNFSALVTMVLCEEYVFRYKLLLGLSRNFGPITSVLLTSVAYVLVKSFQFQISPEDYISLFLLNISIGLYFLRTGKVYRGLMFLSTLYGVIHLIFGLPMWGHNSSGIFLILDSNVAFRSVTGGSLGPLSGVAMMSVLLLVAGTNLFLWRKDNA